MKKFILLAFLLLALPVSARAQTAEGNRNDPACATATGICSMIALLKYLNNAVIGPIAAGTNVIGYVGIDALSSGSLATVVQADGSVAISISTATTTTLVALSSGKKIYVSSLSVIAGGAGNITFEYGTGSNCASGTTALTGAYPLVANSGISLGAGLGPVLVIPSGNALCALTSAGVQMSGHVGYTQQ